MVGIVARSFSLSAQQMLVEHFKGGEGKRKLKKPEWQCHAMTEPPKAKRVMVKNQTAVKPSTYSSRMTTDIPLYEASGASFDRYLEQKSRVFASIFPDKRRSQKLNEEEWRIHMLPINFIFLTVWPVVDMRLRYRTGGKGYPPGVPRETTKVLELDITRWELRGLDDAFDPSQFSLGVKGALYPDRRRRQTRLKGQLEMSMSIVLPPVMALIPDDVRKTVAESMLTGLVENMKHKVNGSLLSDYSKFKRERL